MPEPDDRTAGKTDLPEPGLMEPALLHDLVRWREALARSIARNNLAIRSDQIMAALNRILFPLLFLRIAEDRQLVPGGTLAGLCDLPSPDLITALAPYADALYLDTSSSPAHATEPAPSFVVEEREITKIFDALLAPGRRYHGSTMTTGSLSRVLLQYLTRTVRRSATHQAIVVDTHDTVVSGGTVIPPQPLVDYMARQALLAGRKNRSARELIPLRVLDPACGSGTVLLAVYRQLLEEAGGPALTVDERREILVHSVHGLDMNRHAVAVTRMLLVLELLDGEADGIAGEDFPAISVAALRDLRHSILCGNALVSPAIVDDESWMFCPARDRHSLNPFSYTDRFPEIVAGGGFDLIVCNPPEGAFEQREWLQQYFQRHFAVYHPLIDRSAYVIERSLSLVPPGGTVSCILTNRWLRGSAGSPLRDLLNSRHIEGIVDLSPIPPGTPGAGLCLVMVRASRPARTFPAVTAGPAFLDDPEGFVARHRFPVDQQAMDKRGWALRDTRAEEVIRKASRHSTPLEEFVMGEVHAGIRIAGDDPRRIDEALAKEWQRKDPRCKPLIRKIIAGTDIGRYHSAPGGEYLIMIPAGWTLSHPAAEKKPWQWFRHRHPLIARHLLTVSETLKARAGEGGPEALWWESVCLEFWQEPRKKILFPARFARPVFLFDAGRGIGDEAALAIPSAGLYLAGVLNSRLLGFLFDQARKEAPDRNVFSWDDLGSLPVFTPDFDRPEDLARHDRIEKLVRRRMGLEKNCQAAPAGPECDAVREKIRATDRQIDGLVYSLYGLTPDEVAVVESAEPRNSPA
jgi:adenine-specific DNA-methyltransferase